MKSTVKCISGTITLVLAAAKQLTAIHNNVKCPVTIR